MGPKYLLRDEIVKVIAYEKAGYNISQISDLVGHARSTVRMWISRNKNPPDDGTPSRKKGTGPKPKTSKYVDRLLKREVTNNPSITAREIKLQYPMAVQNLAISTIQDRCHRQFNFPRRLEAVKSLLNPKTKAKRLEEQTIKEEEIETKQSILQIKEEIDIHEEDGFSQEVQAKLEWEKYQDTKMEISHDKCVTTYLSENCGQRCHVFRKPNLDNQEEDVNVIDKLLKCSDCDYSCAHNSHMTVHIKAVHNLEKPFKCGDCDYSCGRKERMTVHVKAVHNHEKPFKCCDCDYSCALKGNMTKHVKTVHNREKPFKCSDCDYSCVHKCQMTMHVKAVHNREKPFKCSECNYSCARKWHMIRHIKAVHNRG